MTNNLNVSFYALYDPGKEYTVSLNLDDANQLMVQNMNDNENSEETAELIKDLFPDFSYEKRK